MAEIIVDIAEIKTSNIPTKNILEVEFKKEIIWIFISTALFLVFGMIMLLKTQKFYSFFFILIIFILYVAEKYVYYFPINIPYFRIDSIGISYKNKKISWQEIKTIKYQIVQPNVNISGNFLNLGLENKMNISIDLNPAAINSTIEIIAAHIKKYWP